MREPTRAGWASGQRTENPVSFLENKKITRRKVPSKYSARCDNFCGHFVHADKIDSNRENAEIERDADRTDQVKQENPLTAWPPSGSEDVPNRQVIVRCSCKCEGARAADQIVLIQPIQNYREERPFHYRADATNQKIPLGGNRDFGSPDAYQVRSPGLAIVSQELFSLGRVVFPSVRT